MFLYELALELDVRSTALLDRAHALGINVDPTAQLTADQVAQLRAAYGKDQARQALAETLRTDPGGVAAGEQKNGPLGFPAIAALVVAGLVVVLLLGYAVTNSGDDGATIDVAVGDTADQADDLSTSTEPCDPDSGIGIGAIGQDPGGDPASSTVAQDGASTASAPTTANALPPCDVVGGLSDDEIAAASTTFDGDPLDIPRDKRQFCIGALGIVEFEGKLLEVSNVDNLGPIRDVMIAGRDKFHADLALMQENAPPRLDAPLDRYAIVYQNLLASATPEADDYTLAVAFVEASRTDLAYYATQINMAVTEHCDKR